MKFEIDNMIDVEAEGFPCVPSQDITILWINGYWDYPRDGICLYQGRHCYWLMIHQDVFEEMVCQFCREHEDDYWNQCESGKMTEAEFDRIFEENCTCEKLNNQRKYLLFEMTPEQEQAEIVQHAKFSRMVGDHWDTPASPYYSDGKFDGRTEESDAFYQEKKKPIPPVGKEQIIGYFVGRVGRNKAEIETNNP